MKNTPTRISLYGFPKRDRNAIEVLLRHDSGGVVIVDDPEHADVQVIDLDGPAHEEVWEQARREFDGPRVVISVRERAYADPDEMIRKPYHSSRLLEAIHRLAERFPEIDDRLVAASREAQPGEKRAVEVPETEPDEAAVAGAETDRKRDTVELESIPVATVRETISPQPEGPFSAIRSRSLAPGEDDGIPTLTIREEPPTGFVEETPAEPQREESPEADDSSTGLAEVHFLDVHPGETDELSTPDSTVQVEVPPIALATDPVEESGYDPEKTLQGIVARAWEMAGERNMPLEICELGEPLILCPRRRIVLTTLTDEHLESLSQMPLNVEDVEVSWVDPFMVDSIVSQSTDRPVSFNEFCWKVALMCSRGRLPEGVSPSEPVELRMEDDEHPAYPGGAEMIALWKAEAVSLTDTSVKLGYPAEEVFTFFSAMRALGLADVPGRHRKGLFSRLFHKLA